MSVLKGKNVLLGITGGIAAFKTAALVRLFVKAGANVKVVMTPAAKEFITPLTLSTLSKNEVFSSFTDEEDENATWNNHVELGLWADFMLIAPATASTLSKMASGNSDNFLLATYLSAKCPVFFAPAMDLDMYKHPSTKNSFQKLQEYENIMIPAGEGELASSLHGEGRMAEPEEILHFIENYYSEDLPLKGRKILITAGPTYEAIDPVRFIGNHSSGKMGYEIAETAMKMGAAVTLISGPTHLNTDEKNINLIRVTSTREMYEAALSNFGDTDVFISAAAVADYKPKYVAEKKIKKNDESLSLELTKTEDILASLGAKKKNQKLIGFALETNNEVENARKKLKKKKLDFIVLNSLNDKGAGFKSDTNKISIIYPDRKKDFELKSKKEVAGDILREIIDLINA
ncbi:bifunctional phosphopantothenoylcysteine decarboxylase/phosphopantothenate--cysteine ligase CoaBC [Gramella sp. MAR_2010_147]|uniref:bifunctional phosphopantothenoylcysteine decarboxylase/phosphopantothenate--cysteine ligase CoaBC n=1 Tax=Gramella sp. MAR_2010_147 TaxID=1250205 RepID=UPI00087A611B|nr:bifunctional phosphopantothenoylcysteine decarboxylase/phosphopantothenate--cysteine ligase CoaBC [Gramella sp. MAR_2010_147]SDR98039.1 phosphopantothenoylcysteine decarboxylase / phosphopantothenate--cysteine ligase [Gramella sp. MAR_2010_147]